MEHEHSPGDLALLRAEYGVQPLSYLEARHAFDVRNTISQALKSAAKGHPGGPLVFAARLLGVHRSRLARLKRKHRIADDGTLRPDV